MNTLEQTVSTPPNPQKKAKSFTWKGRLDVPVLKPHTVDPDQIIRDLHKRK